MSRNWSRRLHLRSTCDQQYNNLHVTVQSSEHAASNEAADRTPISQPSGKKKRSRVEKEQENVPMNPDSETKEEIPVSKRKRNPPLPSDTAEEFQESSYAYETEDISAEVQRRLRIKEETRRKKENMKPDKRKRDSLLSNESSSPGGHKPQKKRVRVESELKSMVSGQGGQRKAKRQKQ